jgi:drug/metabolite transporter (DMT)-like permease
VGVKSPEPDTAAAAQQPALGSGLLLATLGATAFSGKAIIAKLAYGYGVDAITLVGLRMLFALPLFAALSVWASRGQPPLQRRDWALIAGLGFTGYYLASTLDFLGLQYVSASSERLILYLNPTLVLLLGVLLFKQPVTRRQLVALVVSYAGVLLVFGHELLSQHRNAGTGASAHAVLGSGLIFLSAASYAVYLVTSGAEVKRLGALRLTGLASTAACLLCIAQFVVLRPLAAMATAPEVIGLSLLNATLCTFAPVLMVMMAIERIGAARVAQAGMVGPVSTLLLSVWLLGEPFTAWLAAGTVLVMSGVWLLAKWR